MYKKLHIQILNPPAIYVQLANAPDEIANSNFSGKIPNTSACYFDCDKLRTFGQTIKKYKKGRNTVRVL
jgi:hypothetical protein